MQALQDILGSLRDGIGADLARYVAGDQYDLDRDDTKITAEDVFAILARAKAQRIEEHPASAE
jgi:hypothetical protein